MNGQNDSRDKIPPPATTPSPLGTSPTVERTGASPSQNSSRSQISNNSGRWTPTTSRSDSQASDDEDGVHDDDHDEQDHLLGLSNSNTITPIERAGSPRLYEEQSELPPSPTTTTQEKEKPVTWRSLPRKNQLAILTLARLSEP